jgi:hypothetical protein
LKWKASTFISQGFETISGDSESQNNYQRKHRTTHFYS